ncbi:MAG: hypothetical protein JW726_04080 [Anaerolineales bacterium]|nr:hypothetical protein [Anaerolineales bacterium]
MGNPQAWHELIFIFSVTMAPMFFLLGVAVGLVFFMRRRVLETQAAWMGAFVLASALMLLAQALGIIFYAVLTLVSPGLIDPGWRIPTLVISAVWGVLCIVMWVVSQAIGIFKITPVVVRMSRHWTLESLAYYYTFYERFIPARYRLPPNRTFAPSRRLNRSLRPAQLKAFLYYFLATSMVWLVPLAFLTMAVIHCVLAFGILLSPDLETAAGFTTAIMMALIFPICLSVLVVSIPWTIAYWPKRTKWLNRAFRLIKLMNEPPRPPSSSL